jgi:hypothetical protein
MRSARYDLTPDQSDSQVSCPFSGKKLAKLTLDA